VRRSIERLKRDYDNLRGSYHKTIYRTIYKNYTTLKEIELFKKEEFIHFEQRNEIK
jgi:hypothetical protein